MTAAPFGLFRRWLPIAAVATVLCVLTYAAVQQGYRSGADDPQIQMAEDATRALESGATVESTLPTARVDLERGLSPFLIVYDSAARPIAGSGTLRGTLPSPPPGVFDVVRTKGEDVVTWQPERGVRIASVVRRSGAASAGFVLAGRSLRLVEDRERQLREMCAMALAVALVGSLVLCWALPERTG